MDVSSVGLSKTAVVLIRLGGGLGCASIYVGWEVSVPGHRLIGGDSEWVRGKNIQLRFGSQLSALGQSNGKRQRQKLAGRGIGSPTVARSGGLRMAHPAGLGGLRRMSNGKSNDNGEIQGLSTPLRFGRDDGIWGGREKRQEQQQQQQQIWGFFAALRMTKCGGG